MKSKFAYKFGAAEEEAINWRNREGTIGGIVASSAKVADSALILERAVIFPNAFIDESAVVCSETRVRRGSFVGSGAIVGPDVTIGDGTRIGEETRIGAHSQIRSCCIIGDDSVIGHSVTINDMVKIGSGAEIGDHSTLMPYVRIGDNVCLPVGTHVPASMTIETNDWFFFAGPFGDFGQVGVTHSMKEGLLWWSAVFSGLTTDELKEVLGDQEKEVCLKEINQLIEFVINHPEVARREVVKNYGEECVA